jgi:hypothetical protein
MPNFKSAAKRKRELAKLDKRQAKEQKRALRKAERSGTGALAPTAVAVARPVTNQRPGLGAPPVRKPMTLTEAVERWKNTRIARPTKQ